MSLCVRDVVAQDLRKPQTITASDETMATYFDGRRIRRIEARDH